MRKILAVYGTAMFMVLANMPAFAQTAPGQTVNVTPNQQTTNASATSSPSGQNISQQNNFSDPGVNSFGPGIQCAGPYLASSVYRNDSSNPGSIGVGGYSDVGGTIGIVVPLNGSNKKCQEFANEIVFQRQIDTCLSMAKQGFAFEPNGQYASLAKRCSGIHYTGQPVSSANPITPPPPPTVITVPANPQGSVTLPVRVPSVHAEVRSAQPSSGVETVDTVVSASPVTLDSVPHLTSYCQKMDGVRKKRLIAKFKSGVQRKNALETLHAACVTDSEIMAAL